MANQKDDSNNTIPYLFALAARLEGEGQYNNAKLARSAAEAISRRAAFNIKLPSGKSTLADELYKAIDVVSNFDVSSDLTDALKLGADAMVEARLPLIDETPHPYICRTCGHLVLKEPSVNCPVCNARPQTFKRFLPVYWLDALDPFDVLERLRQTPQDVAALMEGLTEEDMNQVPEDGGWNIRNAVSHLRDAQGVMEFRINLMIDQDNPKLESKAVFEWAAREEERPPTTEEIFKTYYESRQKVLTKLENLHLRDWWRTGEHEEFGTLTIKQQASYFASHEITHFPQIESLINHLK